MRDFFRFWGRCVVWALAGWERGQSVAGLLMALASRLVPLGLVAVPLLLAPDRIEAITDLGPLLAWAPVAYLLLLLLVAAPYAVWKRERRRADTAEARLQVRLSVRGEVRNERGKVAVLIIRNLGAGSVAGCSGELKAVYKCVDGRREPLSDVYPLYLRWSRRYEQSEASPRLTFNTTAELEVVRVPDLYLGRLEVRSFQQQRMPLQASSGIFWLDEWARYIFEVELSAENCEPLMREYWLSLHPLGRHATSGPDGSLDPVPLPEIKLEARDVVERHKADHQLKAGE